MAYPQHVTWSLAAFALLEQVVKERKPFTSLDFKLRLRKTAAASVRQTDVGEWLRQAFADGHMEGFDMDDTGKHRIYKPKTLMSRIMGFLSLLSPPKADHLEG